MEVPLDSFVSTSSKVYLMYAYGGYIDLMSSLVQIKVSVTSCIGLTLGCYSIPATGSLEIGSNVFNWREKQGLKSRICAEGNMMSIYVAPSKTSEVGIEVLWCEIENQTLIIVANNIFRGGQQNPSDKCLKIHVNPYITHPTPGVCLLSVKDYLHDHPLQLETTLGIPHSFLCGGSTLLLGSRLFINATESNYENIILIFPDCVYLKSKVTMKCRTVKKIDRSIISYRKLQHDLLKNKVTEMCVHYATSTDDRHMSLMYAQHPHALTLLEKVITKKMSLGSLSYFLLNNDIGHIQMTVILSVSGHSTSCGCVQIDLHIAYQDLMQYRIILLH